MQTILLLKSAFLCVFRFFGLSSFDTVTTLILSRLASFIPFFEVIPEILQNPAIQLTNGEADGLEMILTQRYLAWFLHSPWNSYYEYRRTGYPKLPINPETSLNEVKTELPQRWMYPESESQYNKANLQEALERQFNGSDDRNKKMWILQ